MLTDISLSHENVFYFQLEPISEHARTVIPKRCQCSSSQRVQYHLCIMIFLTVLQLDSRGTENICEIRYVSRLQMIERYNVATFEENKYPNVVNLEKRKKIVKYLESFLWLPCDWLLFTGNTTWNFLVKVLILFIGVSLFEIIEKKNRFLIPYINVYNFRYH